MFVRVSKLSGKGVTWRAQCGSVGSGVLNIINAVKSIYAPEMIFSSMVRACEKDRVELTA